MKNDIQVNEKEITKLETARGILKNLNLHHSFNI